MLGWFADEADPDAGLLAFRRVSEELGTIHWYLKMLRDEGSLGRAPRPDPGSQPVCGGPPGAVAGVGRDPRGARRPDPARPGAAPAHPRQRRGTKAGRGRGHGVGDAAAPSRAAPDRHRRPRPRDRPRARSAARCPTSPRRSSTSSSSSPCARWRSSVGSPLGGAMAAIGMGSLGGREMGYASDADVIFVHRATGEVLRRGGPAPGGARRPGDAPAASDLPARTRSSAWTTTCVPRARPARWSAASTAYTTYYERWAPTWEFQALLRARPVGGDPDAGPGVHGRHRARCGTPRAGSPPRRSATSG